MVRQERAWKTHELLLDASADEFARHGYAGANLNRIAVRTGMTKGALYAHFPSKSALADALTLPFDQAWRDLLRQAEDAGRPLGALWRLSSGLAGRLHTDVRFRAGLRLVYEQARARSEVPAVVGELARVLTRLACDAQRRGELRCAHDPEALSDLIVVSLLGAYHATPAGELDGLHRRLSRIWGLVVPPEAGGGTAHGT